MLTDAQLDAMRSTQEAALPITGARIKRNTPVSDSAGGLTQSWANTGGAVACRIAAADGNEAEVASRLAIQRPTVITLPEGTDVTAADRIYADGRTFAIAAVLDEEWSTATRVLASELT